MFLTASLACDFSRYSLYSEYVYDFWGCLTRDGVHEPYCRFALELSPTGALVLAG